MRFAKHRFFTNPRNKTPALPVYKGKKTLEGTERREDRMAWKDQEILTLCLAREQRALAAMDEAYGAYCHRVAHNVLGNTADAEECVNDAYLAVWNAIPTARPEQLLPYLAKTTRNIALKRLEHNQAQKRDGRLNLLLDELAEVLPGETSLEDELAQRELMEAINDFLKHKAHRTERQLFLRRYFWGDSVGDLCVAFRFSESKVRSQLFRTRQRLRRYLEERGFLE